MAATSLDDITSRAGVSKGLFYLYFRSKDDLLAALHVQFSTELADRIRTATDPVADWPAKLDACVKAIFDSYQERDDLHEVLFRHGGHVSASHRATHGLVLNAISDLFASGKAAGAFDVEDPEATAVLCWASTHGFDPDFHRDAAPPTPGSSALPSSYSAEQPASPPTRQPDSRQARPVSLIARSDSTV